jgi:alpha-L-fucosidase
MSGKVSFAVLLMVLSFGFGQAGDNKIPLAPVENRKPQNYHSCRYPFSIEMLEDSLSEKIEKIAAIQYDKVKETNAKGTWKPTPESIDNHQAPEWFKDAKFGMFIDWGLWSVAGWAPAKDKGAMYPDWYEYRMDTDSAFIQYHNKNWGSDFKRDDFIPLFQANKYQPAKLAAIARAAGMKYIVPFCKHHGGFCLWPSSYTLRDASDMGPGRDLIKPLVESCHHEGLKFGFYFSIEEWEYPLIGEDDRIQIRGWGNKIKPLSADLKSRISGKIAVKNFTTGYLVPQATEFIDMYDPDMLWFDGDWDTNAEELHTYEMASYFYNQAEGRKEVAVNDRYGPGKGEKWQRSKRGDFFTNEYGDMEKEAKQDVHAWEECRGISQSFGYNWQDTGDNVISSGKFIDMFADIVSHGGNLLLIVNLDGQGALPRIEEERLHDIGKWLQVNGEGIYATRPFLPHKEGQVVYTRSKDNRYVYAIMKQWPGSELLLKNVKPEKNSRIMMLGFDNTLEWEYSGEGIKVKFPLWLQDEKHRPCLYAWTLKIKTL